MVNNVYLNCYGVNSSDVIFQIVYPPIMIPITPIPIANNKKFFLSIILLSYDVPWALIIANVPSNASSNRIVSVA